MTYNAAPYETHGEAQRAADALMARYERILGKLVTIRHLADNYPNREAISWAEVGDFERVEQCLDDALTIFNDKE